MRDQVGKMNSSMAVAIPEPHAVQEILLEDGAVTLLRRHGNPAGPRLVLSHGNGLAIDLYYPFWSLLVDEFDLFLYDLRNHGWNSVGAREKHNLPTLVQDHDTILEVIDRDYGTKPKIGVFHSLAGLITLLSDTGDFAARMLFDPPLCKPGARQTEFDAAVKKTAALTRRRTQLFKTQENFRTLLQNTPALAHVVPQILDLMPNTTLRESGNGAGYELRCPREYEAQIVDYFRSFSVLVDFDALSCPTKVLGADPTLPYAYLPTFDLSHVVTVDYDFLPGATHFLPLERPANCVAALREFLNRNGLM